MNVDRSIEDKVSGARITLMHDHPFFASLMFSLDMKYDDKLVPPTAAVNTREMRLHPGFVKGLDRARLVFLIAHEVMHPALLHTLRRGSRDPLLWNIAADIVINRLLIESGVGVMPEGGIDMPDLYKQGDGVVDKIYELLKQMAQGGGEGGGNGLPEQFDNCEQGGGNSEGEGDGKAQGSDPTTEEARWKAKLAQATIEAQKAGKMPAGLARLVDSIVDPKVPWQSVLAQFTRQAKSDDRTWSKPNRRYMPHGMYMPDSDGVQTDELIIAIDCSGSITDDLLSQFAAELRAIQEDTRPSSIHVIYFDSEVSHYDKFDLGEDVSVAMHGGGGTAFSPIFSYAKEKGIDPAACVVLTDLCCDDFGPEPSYPVLWVSTMDGTAPWGRIVIM